MATRISLSCPQWRTTVIGVHMVLLLGGCSSAAMAAAVPCYPALFSFGDSRMDTGEVQAAFPFQSAAEFPPYGQTYFGRPASRFCDGRLFIDFLAQAYNFPFLSPYLQGLHSDFRRGINFAASAANARPVAYQNVNFNLQVQFLQYKKAKLLAAAAKANGGAEAALAPDAGAFANGLHVVSIGENDYRMGYLSNLSYADVGAMVPHVVGNITVVLEGLYALGARNFLVSNLPVEGCKPFLLALLPAASPAGYDRLGCLDAVNNVTRQHNAQLKAAVLALRATYPDALFIFADDYAFNLFNLEHHNELGFEFTTRACCGSGPSVYNFNALAQCGSPGATACPDPSRYLIWDGIHPTEEFYHRQALSYLAGTFIDPPGALAGRGCAASFPVAMAPGPAPSK